MGTDIAKLGTKAGRHGWQPGQSGNPKGRAKGGLTLSSQLRSMLEDKLSKVPLLAAYADEYGFDPETTTVGELVAASAIRHAVQGNPGFYKEIFARIEGKLPDQVNALVTHQMADRHSDAELQEIIAAAEGSPN